MFSTKVHDSTRSFLLSSPTEDSPRRLVVMFDNGHNSGVETHNVWMHITAGIGVEPGSINENFRREN
jgi:hypothetical protein